jgi:hypothetical protein
MSGGRWSTGAVLGVYSIKGKGAGVMSFRGTNNFYTFANKTVSCEGGIAKVRKLSSGTRGDRSVLRNTTDQGFNVGEV